MNSEIYEVGHHGSRAAENSRPLRMLSSFIKIRLDGQRINEISVSRETSCVASSFLNVQKNTVVPGLGEEVKARAVSGWKDSRTTEVSQLSGGRNSVYLSRGLL